MNIIGWFSGGITSAVSIKLAIDLFPDANFRIFTLQTRNEDDDTERFTRDCEQWYGLPIEEARNTKYEKIQDVWYRYISLNVAHGAICSSELKREVRKQLEQTVPYDMQIFGFDINEAKRARAMYLNYPQSKPFYPLLGFGITKKDCFKMLPEWIEPPRVYKLGFSNNNCFKTGCVQGGIGYWQKMQREFPDKFEEMAKVEHELTNIKGEPVTCLKDQSKNKIGKGLVFLLPHPDYPDVKYLSMMTGREPEPMIECNGFCGTYDLEPQTQKEVGNE